MDAWARLHLNDVTQRQAERLAAAELERLALTHAADPATSPAIAGPARPRIPAATRGEPPRSADGSRVAACADCPAGQAA